MTWRWRYCGNSGADIRPCWIEDVHWADEATLDVLTLLARRIESVPALVLASHRDAFGAAADGAGGGGA
jgi:hypothetical protein